MNIKELELCAANVVFKPALWMKTKDARQVFLHVPGGKIYHYGYTKGKGIFASDTATLINMPEVERREVVVTVKTKKILHSEILKRLLCPHS